MERRDVRGDLIPPRLSWTGQQGSSRSSSPAVPARTAPPPGRRWGSWTVELYTVELYLAYAPAGGRANVLKKLTHHDPPLAG
jgi:hypothetical protein